MTKQEEIREGVDRVIIFAEIEGQAGVGYPTSDALARQIINYLHSQGVMIKVDGLRYRPLNPFDTNTLKGMHQTEGYMWTFDNMLKAGYVAVEPLVKE